MSKDNVVVGFVGLGTMGGRMAANMQKAGFKLVVHDLHRQTASHHLNAGAIWADSPRALASQADVIFSSLPEPPDVEAVALGPDGLIGGMKPGAAYFDLSTNSPSVVKKLHAAFAEKGAHMLDAPVSGGPTGAASRKLAIWVGGDENVFNQHKAVLGAIGDKAAYIGPIGSATVAKLVHNMSGYAIICALAETFTMGVKAGVEPLALWQAVRQGAAGRRFTFDALIDQFQAPAPIQQLKRKSKAVGRWKLGRCRCFEPADAIFGCTESLPNVSHRVAIDPDRPWSRVRHNRDRPSSREQIGERFGRN
jgi:3-hydroxyisobutyrate dehydrogenase